MCFSSGEHLLVLLFAYKLGKDKIRSCSGFAIFRVLLFVTGNTAEYTTLLTFSFKEEDWQQTLTVGEGRQHSFLWTVNVPHFHRKSAPNQQIQSSQTGNGTLTKKTKDICCPSSLFWVPLTKVLLKTATLSFSHSLLPLIMQCYSPLSQRGRLR